MKDQISKLLYHYYENMFLEWVDLTYDRWPLMKKFKWGMNEMIRWKLMKLEYPSRNIE